MLSQHFCVFLCAAENGSFNKAAEKLLISPTAVMKHVNSLESELELRLFERQARGLTLTEAGNILYNRGLAIQKAAAQALSEARQVANKWQYTVTVGTSLLNPCKVFMDLWAQINWQCPQLKLNVVPFDDNHSDILSVIDSIGKKLDFLVGVCDAKQWLERCQMLTLGSYKKCIAMPFTHRLAKKKRLNLADLYGETLMMVKEGNSPINDKLRADLQKNHPQIMKICPTITILLYSIAALKLVICYLTWNVGLMFIQLWLLYRWSIGLMLFLMAFYTLKNHHLKLAFWLIAFINLNFEHKRWERK